MFVLYRVIESTDTIANKVYRDIDIKFIFNGEEKDVKEIIKQYNEAEKIIDKQFNSIMLYKTTWHYSKDIPIITEYKKI